ncbi:MAG: LysM peptidoglycan-binding domain-containing protein [Planctomycetes bacterium]|nr:LysM peptidoglycan-binding domain-containing protein [Planctomycetota bacterium]
MVTATRPVVMPLPPTTAPAAVVERHPETTSPISTEPLTPPIESSTVASPVAPSPTAPKPTLTTESDRAKANREHVIQPGDSFSKLAVKYFGHAKYTDLIQNANPDMDPRKLLPGKKIVIPPNPEPAAGSAVVPSPAPSVVPPPAPSPMHTGAEPARAPDLNRMLSARRLPAPEPAAAERAYTVKAGDNWETLARRFMGTPNWTELYEHNKERLKGDRRNLRPGLVIELPEGANLAALSTTSTRPASR